MMTDDIISRYEALKLEICELESTKAEATRAWHESGQATPMGTRAAIDARLAKAKLERMQMRPQVTQIRSKKHHDKGNRLLTALIRQCRAAGMDALVAAAHQDAERIEA